MKYRMIWRCRGSYPVRMMRRCLNVSPSGFYGWQGRPLRPRAQKNVVLSDKIRELHEQSDGVMGSPRIHDELLDEGWRCSDNRVARPMSVAGLRGVPPVDDHEVILHSDRGCQFTSDEYRRFLESHYLICSMSAVGSCADYAACEGFFGMLKRERVNRKRYLTRAQTRSDVFDYIERWYNPRRRRAEFMLNPKRKLLTKVSVEME